jgi:LysR family transcriptional activator of nhaA
MLRTDPIRAREYAMDWLNYHHLLYFWTAAREGSITAAARKLRLAQPTLSAQIGQLEERLGADLFVRRGRSLALSDAGKAVFDYAEQIFTLGQEMVEVLEGRRSASALKLVVGIADVLPKLVVYRLLAPALSLERRVRLVCREGNSDRLLAELSLHGLDLVLSDSPVGSHVGVRAFSHLLGESEMSFFAAPKLARSLRRRFPQSLDGAPFLLPGEQTMLRRSLEQWFQALAVRPQVAGEFADNALLGAFGQAGVGAFAAPTAIEKEVSKEYGVVAIGRAKELRERYYAITLQRRLVHPGVQAVWDAAKVLLTR